jgi:hypothetical protein
MYKRTNDGPDAILLANVVRTGTKTFLPTDRQAISIHQVAEVFPAYIVQ